MKVCTMCGAQNEDVFTKCATCGADLPSVNSEAGDDEKTVLLDPEQAGETTSGFSLNTNANTYGQQGGFQQAPQQTQPDFDPSQPYAGQPDYGQAQPYSMPVSPQPKSNKGLIIGILAAAIVAVAVVLVLIFKGGLFGAKGGTGSPEDVAKQFIEAMDEQDVDKLAELCPPFLDPGKDELQDMIDAYSGYDVTFTYEGVDSKDDYTGSDLDDLEEDVSDYAEKNVKLDAACDLEFSFNVAVTMLGETYDESSSYTITCIKYKGKWFLYE